MSISRIRSFVPRTATLALMALLALTIWLRPGPLRAEITIDGLSPQEGFRFMSALRLAERRLERKLPCSSMFESLDADGINLLLGASYERASQAEEKRWCAEGGVALFTTVGGDRVGICPQAVQDLDRFELAMVLIHEALHMGGVEESPATPSAPTSAELNRLVRGECSL